MWFRDRSAQRPAAREYLRHVEQTLGPTVDAILAGHSMPFVPAPTLVAQLAKAHSEGRLVHRLLYFTKPKPLIIGERDYLSFGPNAARLFFQLVSCRFKRGSMLITRSHRVSEWGMVFGNSATPLWRPRSSADCRATATSSPSAATAAPARGAPFRVVQSASGRSNRNGDLAVR